MVVDGANDPVDLAATQQERVDEALEEVGPIAALLEQALTACKDPLCPIYNDGDPIGYFKQAVTKLDLVNSAADNPSPGRLVWSDLDPVQRRDMAKSVDGSVRTERERRPVYSA